MHPLDMFIVLSTGTAVGWTSAIYVNHDFRLMIAYILGCPAAAALAGYLSLTYYPQYGSVGILGGAVLFAILFRILAQLVMTRFLKKMPPRDQR